MPPFSQTIDQEGWLVRNHWLIRAGELCHASWVSCLQEAASRPDPALLWADLQAQAAANRLGVDLLQELLQIEGEARLLSYLQHVQDHAAAIVRRLLDGFENRGFQVELDNGACLNLAVRMDRDQRSATLDFSGTSAQGDHNFHAPLAVTKAAVLYVLRCLVDEPIPLNAGCFLPLTLVVPEGSLLNPKPPAAVVAGNVRPLKRFATCCLPVSV